MASKIRSWHQFREGQQQDVSVYAPRDVPRGVEKVSACYCSHVLGSCCFARSTKNV